MRRTRVGVRELKAHLSGYLRMVKAGQIVVITEHDREIARILPAKQSLAARVQAMVESGLAAWSGSRPGPYEPVAHTHGDHTVADLLIQDRQ